MDRPASAMEPTPLLHLAAAAGLILLGLFLAAVMLFRDPRRSLRRCSLCWYDMTAVSGLRCPECGRNHPGEPALHRPRRRWKLAMLALPLFALAGGVIAGRERMTRLYYALMPAWKVAERTTVDTCEVTCYRRFDPERWDKRVVVRQNGTVLADIVEYRVTAEVPAPYGIAALKNGDDLTNDGIPDMVITTHSGGAHCCSTYYVIQLGEHPALPAKLDAPDHGAFVREPDGRVIYRTVESVLNYWHAPYSGSPHPPVTLIWSDGRFRVSPEHMRTPPPTAAQLESRAAVIPKDDDDHEPSPDFFGAVVELIYQGHPTVAWEFFDRHWSPRWGDQTAFRAELEHTLAESPFWPDIQAMNSR